VTVSTDHPLGDVLLLKQPDAQTVVNSFLGRAPPTQVPAPGATAPASTQVTVLNALGTTGLAATAATQLRRSGYRITTVGNAPSADLSKSQITYAPGRLADAKTLAATLLGGARLIEDPTLTTPNLTLILGPGFTGIRPLTTTPSATTGGSSTTAGSSAGGGSGSGAKKPSKKAVPDLRPYDPRPC
jgi:hypothetical protein